MKIENIGNIIITDLQGLSDNIINLNDKAI